ncbi:MAG: glycosyltransferase [Limisphaerales bacterium]
MTIDQRNDTQSGIADCPGRPLLTFALISCNQEQFVREAVEAAFAQTYSPLQIVLSDDCSDDRSFEIMRQMAEAYHGPHEVVLNRNPVRRKTGGHFNRVMEIARGALIVIAAADDISLPHRTQAVYEAWERTGKKATSIFSDLIQIDEGGAIIEQFYKGERLCERGKLAEPQPEPLTYMQTFKPTVHGCTHVISPHLFRTFGNLLEQVIYEDKVLAFRSVLSGRVLYIGEPLVKYRLHGANVFKYQRNRRAGASLKSLEEEEMSLHREYQNTEIMYQAFLNDLQKAREEKLVGEQDYTTMSQEAEYQRRRNFLLSSFFESGILGKCRILFQLQKLGMNKVDRGIVLKRLIPQSLFLRIRVARSQIGKT